MKTIKVIIKLTEHIKELKARVAQLENDSAKKDALLFDLLKANSQMGAELSRQQWVSVEDRLPETCGEYIVKVDAYYEPNVTTSWFDLKFLHPHVTHWIPLPELPK